MGLQTDTQATGRICVLGGGNLGKALVKGLIEGGGMDPDNTGKIDKILYRQ